MTKDEMVQRLYCEMEVEEMTPEELMRIQAIVCEDHLPVLQKLALNPGSWHSRWAIDDLQILNVEKEIEDFGDPWGSRTEMQNLIDVGLINGCTCGCRGDFAITPKGEEYLREVTGK